MLKRVIAGVVLAIVFTTGPIVPEARADGVALVPPAQPIVNVNEVLTQLPTGERWLQHLEDDLLKFWDRKEALGEPVGNFPTYRCNDGEKVQNPPQCPELQNPEPGIVWLDRQYVRSRNRQVFAYGIAYNLTGKLKYLDYARAGTDWLRKNALDHENGGAYSYFKDYGKTPAPQVSARNSQDLAYAVTGLAFYYYLTRDADVLSDILKMQEYIFRTYLDPALDLLTWVKEKSPDGDLPNQRELVAQLDQVYGYMMFLTPALPEAMQGEFKQKLRHLAHIMMGQFYSPREGMFWGAITDSSVKRLGTPHTDFGHTVKTLWLIYQIGKLTGDMDLVEFGRDNAGRILEKAYDSKTGSWTRCINADGTRDQNKEWWILAELDQVSGTLGLIDPTYARYLPSTAKYWFTYMVDHEHGGVWHWVNAADNKPNIRFPKQHSWKNALHTFEHALVGYMTAQQIHGEEVVLHYAFGANVPPEPEIQPYFFQGKVKSITRADDGVGYKVVFTDVR